MIAFCLAEGAQGARAERERRRKSFAGKDFGNPAGLRANWLGGAPKGQEFRNFFQIPRQIYSFRRDGSAIKPAQRWAIMSGMDGREAKCRWFSPQPSWLVLCLLAATAFLFLSERFGFHQHKGWSVVIAVASVGALMALMLAWFVIALVFHLRFQFSIRLLLVLAVAVALPFSWLAVEMKKAREQRGVIEALEKLRAEVAYYGTFEGPAQVAQLPGSVWLRTLLGDDFFVAPYLVRFDSTMVTVTDADLEHLQGLSQLQRLGLEGTGVTDAGLDHLKGLTQLQVLLLNGTKVTDAGLEHLKGLSQLQVLCLNGTKVTDAGLERLEGLSQLRVLWLNGTKVTDAGLERLEGLSQLRELGLNGTKVTDAGVKKLQQALTNCMVFR